MRGTSRRARLGTALLFVSVFSAAGARAGDGEVSSAAQLLFNEGQRLLDEGNVTEACPKLEQSLRLEYALGTLLNVAVCHERAGKTATAWAELARAAGRAAATGQRDREQFAIARGAELEKRLSVVEIRVPPHVGTAEVRLDGSVLGKDALAAQLPLDPGEHEVMFVVPGKRPARVAIDVPAGPWRGVVEAPTLEDEPPAPLVLQPPLPAPAPDRGRTMQTIGLGLLATAVVGVAVGTPFGVRAFAKKSEMDDHCRGNGCDATGIAARDDGFTAATISTIAFSVAAAALAAGVYCLVSARPARSRATVRSAPAAGGFGLRW
jgi:hypothetical protein